MLQIIEPVPPALLKPEDIDYIVEADAAGDPFYSITGHLISNLWNGSWRLFRVPGHGVLVLEVNTGSDGSSRLNIISMAGKDLTLRFEQISSDLQHLARKWGCKAIETMVYSDKLAKALTRGGAQRESVTMVLELKNG